MLIIAEVLALAQTIAVAHAANVDYQIHSYNDLREWNQVLLKGARRFKIDPHYMKSEACIEAGIEQEEGCFLLNHDEPVPSGGSYSSTEDLLTYLKSPGFAAITKEEYISIALCFKSAPDKCDDESTAFKNWLKLVDDFYEKCTTDLKLTRPNIEFILDGDAKPSGCMEGRWSDWNSVWIITDGSSPPDAFTSNDSEHGYDRFQILNDKEDYSNWTWVVQEENYGKFSDSSYPIQLWEPDLQSDIQAYIALYHSGEVHSPGFHFAINIDVAMFDVYSGEGGSQRSVNKRAYAGGTGPVVAPLHGVNNPVSTACGGNATQFLLAFADMGRDGNTDGGASPSVMLDVLAYHYQSMAGTGEEGSPEVNACYVAPVEVPRSNWLLRGGASASASAKDRDALVAAIPLATVEETTSVLIVMNNGRMLYSDASFGATELSFDHSSVFELPDRRLLDFVRVSGEAAEALALVGEGWWGAERGPAPGPDGIFFMLSVPETEDGALEGDQLSLSLVVVDRSVHGLSAKILTEVAVVSGLSNGLLTSARVSMVSHVPSPSVLVVCAVDGLVSGTVLNILELVPTMLDSARVRTVTATGSNTPTYLSLGSSSTSTTNTWVYLTVGNTIDVSTVDDAVLLFAGDGYCYNSHSHNTAPLPTMCDRKPHSTPGVLEYSAGLTEDWLQLFDPDSPSAITAPSQEFTLNSCHGSIMHGTYDQGSHPSIAISRSVDGTGYAFVEVHEGVRGEEPELSTAKNTFSASVPATALTSSSVALNKCGTPIAHDGVVIDSFQCSNWIDTLRTLRSEYKIH